MRREWALRLRSVWTLPVNSPGDPLSRRATWRGRAASSRSRGAGPGPGPSGRAGRRGSLRTAAGLGAHPREDVVPLGPVERGDGVGQQGALPGGDGAAVQPADDDPGRRGQRLLLVGAGHLQQRDAAGRGGRPRARMRLIAGSAVSSPASSRCPAGRSPSEPPPATPSRAPGRSGRRPRGGRAVAVQHEVDLHLAGGRVLPAGGVAAQAHPVGAVGPDDPPVLGDRVASAARRRPPAGRAG